MKLIEALTILKSMHRREGNALSCFLATGLNPLHLKTFLAAELCMHFTDQKVEIADGLYGDLLGNLGRLAEADAELGIVLIEWSDLDPRLGIRSTARWGNSELDNILSTVGARAGQIQRTLEEICLRLPLVLCFPTLPLPPISFVPSWQAGSFEIDLRAIVQSVSSKVSRCAQVRVVNPQQIDLMSPLGERLDVDSDVLSGFPYQLTHASALAASLALLAQHPISKKGIITDLDDTLWRGIVGEVGIEGISWDLDHRSQMHAFYQRLLGALASEGVLIGVASKNDRSLVEEALGRIDLALSPASLYPVEASWNPKSESVANIMKSWNVGPDSVVFVDDSPMEIAEVKASHPEVECLLFPTNDAKAIYDLALRLRGMFGKSAVLEEDSIRIESIRRSHAGVGMRDEATATPTSFLEHLEAEITFNFSKTPLDPRALELVNKTNQFNLNGRRYTEGSWQKFILDPSSFLLLASYRDKFGPLGKIALLAGSGVARRVTVKTWVMSCRAFSRRIDYMCIAELLAKFDPCEIEFEYSHTERNGPIRDFLSEILGVLPSPNCTISREALEARLERLHNTKEVTHG